MKKTDAEIKYVDCEPGDENYLEHCSTGADFAAWRANTLEAVNQVTTLIDKRCRKLFLAMSRVESIATQYTCSGHSSEEPSETPHAYFTWTILKEAKSLVSLYIIRDWITDHANCGFSLTLEKDTLPNIQLVYKDHGLVFTPIFTVRALMPNTSQETCDALGRIFDNLAERFDQHY